MWCFARLVTICTILKTWKTPMEEFYFKKTCRLALWSFFTFLICISGPKSRNASHIWSKVAPCSFSPLSIFTEKLHRWCSLGSKYASVSFILLKTVQLFPIGKMLKFIWKKCKTLKIVVNRYKLFSRNLKRTSFDSSVRKIFFHQ